MRRQQPNWLCRFRIYRWRGKCILACFTGLALGEADQPRLSGATPHPEWQATEGFRWRRLEVPVSSATRLTALDPASLGIPFTNVFSRADFARNSNLMNGAGLALGDYDGDGRCDIFLCGLSSPDRLYRNLGHWHFADVTAAAGLDASGRTTRGGAFADVNGDGHLDLILTTFGGPSLCYVNTGAGRFRKHELPLGVVSRPGSTSVTLGDVDGNGTLDLYLCNFGLTAILRDGKRVTTRFVSGKPVVSGRYARRLQLIGNELVEFGEPDVLYLNDGAGNFRPCDWNTARFRDAAGQPMRAPWDFGLSAQLRDLNADGAPDLYVCNDFHTPDRIWLNNGHGQFQLIDPLALRHISAASMGVDFADIDRDGHLDIFVVEMLARDHRARLCQASSIDLVSSRPGEIENRPQIPRNTLFWNRGDNTFAEIAAYAGVAASDWSWQPVFVDVDLDGYEDILCISGISHDLNHRDYAGRLRTARATNWRTVLPPFITPHTAFRNRGDLTFEEVGAAWGFNARRLANSIAMADLDGDGDLDAVINCLNEGPLIYRNDCSAPRLLVRLKGRPPNTQGVGAKIQVTGGPVPQSQEIVAGGLYLAGSQAARMFAAGSITNRLTIQVTWRNGKVSVLSNAVPNRFYEISEAMAVQPLTQPALGPVAPWFADVSRRLRHRHHEEPFDDFALQPLLAKRLSQSGPGVAWFDLDGNGLEELILGTGRGGKLAGYRPANHTRFAQLPSPTLAAAPDDLTGIVGWVPRPGQRVILAGRANLESPPGARAAVLMFSGQNGQLRQSPSPAVASLPASPGPLAVADWDGDGDLDVFVGGRVAVRRYPEPVASRLYRNEAGTLVVDPVNNPLLEHAGLVRGAVLSDLTGDGWPELILACEWGPVRVFENARGKFHEVTAQRGLSHATGWWTGVTTGDLDGDGRLDIIAGNWGLNSPYHPTPDHPECVFYADFNRAGRIDLLEGCFAPELGKLAPRQPLTVVGAALPFVAARWPTHQAYSEAGIQEILGEQLARARRLEVNTLAAMVWLNRGDTFKAVPLPREAQWAPVFGVCVADWDGDGHEDVFLSQNFFATRPELPRLDAGRGLWLRGDGRGDFAPVPGQQSGLLVYGEQRGCAVADFDRDGRVDLVVSQNGAATRLFRNRGAKRGLRVRLAGPPGNPDGVGAVLRLEYGTRWGPAREIHAGSGYLSQDSAIQVLARPERPTRIQVRWPGGQTTRSRLDRQDRDILVRTDGTVQRLGD